MEHKPVMCQEVLQSLIINPKGIYLDCTFGRGGHSEAIIKQLDVDGKLLAFDRDKEAVNSELALALLEDNRFAIRHCCFSELENIVAAMNWEQQIDGVLMDFGVSSPQLDDPQRGFSFLHDGPLDMRMDTLIGLSAAQWLAQVEEKDLIKVLFEYGEERFARRIAKAVIAARIESAIVRTGQLAKLISDAVPKREKNKHPATRSFQAIRIKINRELEEIEKVLVQAVNVLKPGGKLVVISFHSLEDRIVKRFIRDEARGKYRSDRLPIQEALIHTGRLIKQGKAMRASIEEVKENPRARSAILRVAERRNGH